MNEQDLNPPQPEAEPPILSLQQVSLSYWLKGGHLFRHRKYWALKNVSFDIQRGESVGVVGRNGAGKSTLLRLLAGIVVPDEGRVIAQENVKASLLSLSLGLLPHLSGRENAIQGALFQGLNLREFKTRLPEVKEFSGLGDFFEEPIYTYSSGMRARLAFSIAKQIDPDILLVDEVLGVGDTEFRDKAMSVMKERIHAHDQTVVYVSHNLESVKELCTRTLWIENGELLQEGPTPEVVTAFLQHRRALNKIN